MNWLADLPGRLAGEVLRASGWQFLLPRPAERRVVCYDGLGGATMLLLSGLGWEVWVVHHDEAELRRLEETAAVAGARGLRFSAVGRDGSVPSIGPMDGFVLHDPLGTVLTREPTAPSWRRLTAAMGAQLRPGGFLYLGLRHRLAYTRLPGGSERHALRGKRLLSVGTVIRSLRRSGLVVPPAHPLLMHGERILEVVPEGGYRSVKNRFLMTERLREVALGRWGAPHLAPAYGVLAFRGPREESWIERILADPWVQDRCPGARLRRYFVLGYLRHGGKVLLSLAARSGGRGLILVLTPDEEAAKRRREEAAILARLADQLPPALAATIPVPLGERVIEDVRVFALSEFPGLTVDCDAPFLPEMTRIAARWLAGFHLATRTPAQVSPGAYSAMFGAPFEQARKRNPAVAAELRDVEGHVREAVMGRRMQTVWLHGDFKLENVVFDEGHRFVRGVIDWELSAQHGLPLVDVLYLLAYNRRVRAGTDMLEAIAQIIVGPRAVDEEALVAEYGRAFPEVHTAQPVLAAMFFVHHIGYRAGYDLTSERERAAVVAILRLLGEQLSSSAR